MKKIKLLITFSALALIFSAGCSTTLSEKEKNQIRSEIIAEYGIQLNQRQVQRLGAVDFNTREELLFIAEGLVERNIESSKSSDQRLVNIKTISRTFSAADKYFELVEKLVGKVNELKENTSEGMRQQMLIEDYKDLRNRAIKAEKQVAEKVGDLETLIDNTLLNPEQRKSYETRMYNCIQDLQDHGAVMTEMIREGDKLIK